ncbi:MAG TPA: cyclase family protein [Patescibacteria group bacterium]|nr:cyclase family protein [Patescibacteria group bacterium]
MKNLKFYNLSQPIEPGIPLWPWVGQMQDLVIERALYHERDGKQSSVFHCKMHVSTHMDAPFHIFGTGIGIDKIPLDSCFGTGVIVDMRHKKKWDIIGPEDFEKATPTIEKGDWVIVNTGWHHYWDDHYRYINYYPSLYKEGGEWLVEKGVKGFGITGAALDSPLAHAPLSKTMPWLDKEYRQATGEDPEKKFPLYEPAHYALLGNKICGIENMGGDIDEITGKRLTIAAFPLRWIKGDGSMIRVVAIEGLEL